MESSLRTAPRRLSWAAASIALMAAGALGPWAEVLGITIHGTDEGRDGWIVLGAAVTAALLLAAHLRSSRTWPVAACLLAGIAGFGTAAYDLAELRAPSDDLVFSDLDVSPGWGLWLALVGSTSLALAALALLVAARRRDELFANATADA